MKLLFSETKPDYAGYLYPYVIWAVPDPGETPADLFARGFLPASPQLDRFYLCRNLRVELQHHRLTSENRRVLRKGQGIEGQLVARADFDYSDARRAAWKAYADARFGEDVMSFERLDRLMHAPVITHLYCFRDAASGAEVGTVLLYLEPPRVAYYYYAFYSLDFLQRNLGMFMMTQAVASFAQAGYAHLHLGTCYSTRALYKTQFTGVQFFNGHRWSPNLDELKFLLSHQESATGHLLQSAHYLEEFADGRIETLAQRSCFNG